MDTFVDKLAQRLNAQEIIKANSAADAEEMRRLKSEVNAYKEVLDKIGNLTEESLAKISAASVNGAEIDRLVTESIAKIEEIKQAPLQMEEINEKLTALQDAMQNSLKESDEVIHKECVKVYRNVQAVVTEEVAKCVDKLSATEAKNSKKAAATLVFSILSFLFSAGTLTFLLLMFFQVI